MNIDWKKFEQNNKKIALNILFVTHNTKGSHANQNITAGMKIK